MWKLDMTTERSRGLGSQYRDRGRPRMFLAEDTGDDRRCDVIAGLASAYYGTLHPPPELGSCGVTRGVLFAQAFDKIYHISNCFWGSILRGRASSLQHEFENDACANPTLPSETDMSCTPLPSDACLASQFHSTHQEGPPLYAGTHKKQGR